jgi:acyl-CoA synthetase (AMP-forming)/AMP-acid ligase II
VTPLSVALAPHRRAEVVETGWRLTTSGTTGLPKVVPHTLRSLARTVVRLPADPPPIWGMLYDPTRFAGLQVVLQALIGGGRLVLGDTHAALGEQVDTLARHGVTHLSATPTLWRRLLMAPGRERLRLRQATLGGEIADQGTLKALRAAFPGARVTHIYASTEAGVGFSVTDGLAGFPAAYLDAAPGGVRVRVADGMLWVRPPVTALAPGGAAGIEVDGEGYVRTGDLVRVEDGRVLFLGRENGLINVGGVKVYPEAVEAVIATVPGVALSQVSAKRSPVTGALVVAAVQLEPGADPGAARAAIAAACAERLGREATPAIIRFVEGFATNAAGKLVRVAAP